MRDAGATSFVTGATGFVGGRLAARLRELGHDVKALVRPETDARVLEKLGVRIHRGDLRRPESFAAALGRADYAFHVGDINLSCGDYLPASHRVAKAIARATTSGAGLKRLVFVSSISVVFTPPDGVVNEDTEPARPLSDRYHAAKRATERELFAAGAPASIVRPLWIYGPGCRWMVSLVRAAAVAGRLGLPFPGHPGFTTGSIHVDDLIEALIAAAKFDRPAARVFHVHDDDNMTLSEFIDLLGRRLGRPIRLRFPPVRLQHAAAALVDGTGLFGRERNIAGIVAGFSTRCRLSNERTKRELGWTPRYPSPRDGMPSFAEWLDDEMGKGFGWRRHF